MAPSPMFWRIIRRLITANYGRLFVVLLALGAGAAVTSALLNLQIDAKKRLTTEFRALGANVMVAPKSVAERMATNNDPLDDGSEQTTLEESLFRKLPAQYERKPVPAVGLAPLSSMFFVGKNDRRFADDFRGELHDSDGLLMHNGAGEWIWRPLSNPAAPAVSVTWLFRYVLIAATWRADPGSPVITESSQPRPSEEIPAPALLWSASP